MSSLRQNSNRGLPGDGQANQQEVYHKMVSHQRRDEILLSGASRLLVSLLYWSFVRRPQPQTHPSTRQRGEMGDRAATPKPAVPGLI